MNEKTIITETIELAENLLTKDIDTFNQNKNNRWINEKYLIHNNNELNIQYEIKFGSETTRSITFYEPVYFNLVYNKNEQIYSFDSNKTCNVALKKHIFLCGYEEQWGIHNRYVKYINKMPKFM